MNLFFEEDGAFKAGTVMSEAGKAYQVQLTTGRRAKIKAANVFFSFESPSPQELMERAQAMVPELDPAFLWEVASDEEFSYEDMAADYWGGQAGAVEKAALIWALHGNPVYFYRKSRGHYRRAPADILQKALEAIEKKKRLEEQRRQWAQDMAEGKLPEAIARNALTLLVRPDKNGIEWKALSDAAGATRQTPLRLLLSLGGIASPFRWHVDSFYMANFPHGKGFADGLPLPAETFGKELPVADVHAFSIDDSSTTEIDDALSVTHLADGKTRVGVHIAAPSAGIGRDDAVDLAARERMSTVYAPGMKTTMLPEPWIKAFSLDEGRLVPCLSLYVTVDDATFDVLESETRLERIAVERNIRYDKIDDLVTEEAIESGTLAVEYADEISWLWHFARKLLARREETRGRPEPVGRVDWYFALDGDGEDARIELKGRRRGAPLDLLVAEMMILANSTWGVWMEEHGTPGIYRSQRGFGRVRMSTAPAPHEGMGVPRYAWSTSPLRRYVDMINQRQMIATLTNGAPVYQGNDVDLFMIVSQFEAVYGLYSDFQRRMETYWSLRWIMQEGLTELEGAVLKGEWVRMDGLPFVQRVPTLPEGLERGRKVRLQVLGCDLVELTMESRLIEVLDETADNDGDLGDEPEDETFEESVAEGAASEGSARAEGGAETSSAEETPAEEQ